MCGFVGRVSLNFEQNRMSSRALDLIRHRGPDDQVRYQTESLDLFFARLSIVDLEGGRQPFVDPETGVVSVVNGEIYNHEDLRLQLSKLGYRFASLSDAEVVLWGFKHWRNGVFKRLRGMFAIAIYEPDSGDLVLARDALGKKPLYWRRTPMAIDFGSEVAALEPGLAGCVGIHASEYFATDAVAWDGNCECGVTQVAEGGYVVLGRSGQTRREQFWNFDQEIVIRRNGGITQQKPLDTFCRLLENSTRDRMMSDVPVGIFLSNGLDSQLIATVARKVGNLDRSYTLSFEEQSFDESESAAEFSEALGIPNQSVSASLEDLAEVWETYRDSIDEPFADSAILGEMLLARAASQHTKVVLSGDGGDELFLGYQHVQAHRAQVMLGGRISGLNTLASFAVPRLRPQGTSYFSPIFVLERLSRGSAEPDLVARDLAWRVAFDPDRQSKLLRGYSEAREDFVTKLREQLPNSPSLSSWADQWSFLYLKTYLRDIILRKVDRATMRFGVEARSPLLERDLVTFALSLPSQQKSSLVNPKPLIREAMARIGGSPPRRRKKHGMGMPLASLLTGPLAAELNTTLHPDKIEAEGLFDPVAVNALIKEFRLAPSLRAREIWAFLVFSVWKDRLGQENNL